MMRKKLSVCLLILTVSAMVLLGAAALRAQETSGILDCTQCGFPNVSSNNFCINCGNSLKESKQLYLKRTEQAAATMGQSAEEKKPVAVPEELATRSNKSRSTVISQPLEQPAITAVKIYQGPVDPHRLFLMPTANVLSSLEISIGGGSIIGEMKEEKRPFLGRISMGLGDVAEIEASTARIINNLTNGTAAIPTAAFKLKFLPQSQRFPFIGLAGTLRSSLWHSETRDTVKFEKRVSTLYFSASKTFGNVSLHSGLSISDLRIRTKHAATGELLSPTPQEAEQSDKDYVNKNIFNPLFGIQVRVNPKTMLMVEYNHIPEYKFHEKNPAVDSREIDAIWMIIAGVRFFIFDWLPLDTGILYREDFHGIGDMHILAGLNINLPLARMFQAWRPH